MLFVVHTRLLQDQLTTSFFSPTHLHGYERQMLIPMFCILGHCVCFALQVIIHQLMKEMN